MGTRWVITLGASLATEASKGLATQNRIQVTGLKRGERKKKKKKKRKGNSAQGQTKPYELHY